MKDEELLEGDQELSHLRKKLRIANDKYRKAMKTERKLKRRVAELERSLAQAEQELDVRRELESELVQHLLSAEDALARLRTSRPVRLGRLLRSAASQPRKLLRLPTDSARLLFARSRSADTTNGRTRVERLVQAHLERVTELPAAPDTTDEPVGFDGPVVPSEAAVKALSEAAAPRVAMIVDDFTRMSIEPECEAIHLTPHGWREQLENGQPHLLFVESAWRGLDDSWKNQVGHMPKALAGILEWCRANGTPTAFWNKEDPVHFSTFLNVASRFDHIFTTDIESIPPYKQAVGHDRVWLMPFACQPAVHNPIATVERTAGIMFAGAYYRRYPERNRDFESMVDQLALSHNVEIYDRNLGTELDEYRFPDRFAPLIQGTLAPGDVPTAYKRYRYGLNLNSVKQSTTMFARRVFELMASGTLVIGNYSRGVRTMFGDLTVSVDDGVAARRALDRLDESGVRKLRHAALRKVLSEHTYADRFAYLKSRIIGREHTPFSPRVAVLIEARDSSARERLLQEIAAQEGVQASAIVIPGDESKNDGSCYLSEFEYVTVWRANDYHGPNLLRDLAVAHRYADADAVGIAGGFQVVDGSLAERPGARYEHVEAAALDTALVRTDVLDPRTDARVLLASWPPVSRGFAVETFGFCSDANGADVSEVVEARSADYGLPIADLYAAAEKLRAAAGAEQQDGMRVEDLETEFAGFSRPAVRTVFNGAGVAIESALDGGTHDYLFSRLKHRVAEHARDGRLSMYVECTPGLNVQVAVIYYDAGDERLASTVHFANQNVVSEPPSGAVSLRVALRIAGEGSAELRSIEFAHRSEAPGFIPLRGDALLVTNIYPSRDDRYRNGFVHSRVRAYAELGVRVDALTVRPGQLYRTYEHEGIDVTVGSLEVLECALRDRTSGPILVHFLDAPMWDAIRKYHAGRRVLIWLHGSEVQPWWRRTYNYKSEAELEAAKPASDERMAFWRGVFADDEVDAHFVFVSQYFADEVMSDVGVELEPSRYSIVHNPIDTDTFAYAVKAPDMRFKVLSVRPFASEKYANDLSVSAVEILRSEPEFDQMRFHFVGDGPMFESTLAPLVGLPNVKLDKRFLSHHEIASLHRENGIFLVPTRMDAQGVSRDEAMSSGLVPVTTRIAAVPEFVDDESGMLCAPESPESLAGALLQLMRNPKMFSRLSCGAASRVRRQTSQARVIDAELELIGGGRDLA